MVTQASGAYIFRPNSSDTYPVNNNSNKATLTVAMVSIITVKCCRYGNNVGSSSTGSVATILAVCFSSYPSLS